MRICISSGHGAKISGAIGPSPWGLNEHKEAVRVVDRVTEILRANGYEVESFEDKTSTDQQTNLETIVNWHNAHGDPESRLDVSVHFNCNVPTSNPVGTECFYYSARDLAADVSSAVAAVGFKDRGPKQNQGLYFLKHTTAESILAEICFVDSEADCTLYKNPAKWETMCMNFAQVLVGGDEIAPSPEPEPEPEPDDDEKPTLGKGDVDADFDQPYVSELQTKLNQENDAGLVVDGDFGPATDTAVRNYQASRGLQVDGLVGEQTWDALDQHMPPLPPPPGLPLPLSGEEQAKIADIAIKSSIAKYNWVGRGLSPPGYVKGFALAWANTYRQLIMGYPPAVEMAKAKTNNADKDVLSWYAGKYAELDMDNSKDGPDTMRHLWALMMGLGMRESSGEHCVGRDTTASNTTSDTAEAGLFQQSWNSHTASDNIDVLFDAFEAAQGTDNPQGFLKYFEEGVSCPASNWENYGSGNGETFQWMCKNQPSFACEACAVGLRVLRQHWGPISRYEAELKTEADEMLKAIQDYVDEITPMV